MIHLTKDGARYVDDFLQNLQHKFDTNGISSMTVYDYIEQDGNNHKPYEEIYYAFILAAYIQNDMGFKAFQMNIIDNKPYIDYQKGFTDAFLATGGFTTIWENQENERLSKKKIDKVNDSVLKTNKTVMTFSIISALAALASLAVAILSYNDTANINVKELPLPPKSIQQIEVTKQPTDTVYILNQVPSHNQPTK